ncbi:hypothetical protein AN478_00410 [Thiohalorhabdus denitrificans]|uniref:Etoposide-induced protein 2.4 (EI24) n=1 Tax=Thiohalorhabdus denitrificans TaxID=381306 RepID=A0A0N8PNL2_9GAMM|nr:hypothetical protein [Thiohalorhabdus denitrificans]KPV41837.1 hypothetical protein AN478_00410 [Thiohalorhabdus denitrificans]SCY68527.1 hypothetical protein SAMN05661077_0152 [Thiohalorhabdus denitrificans]
MFAGVTNGLELIRESLKAFRRYPSLLLPLLGCWAVYAPVIVYFHFLFPWDAYPGGQQLLVLLGIILLFSFLLSASCLFLLERIREIETAESMGWARSMYGVAANLLRALPITLTWAVIWFVITVIEMLLRRGHGGEDEEGEGGPEMDTEMTAENVAEVLGGFGDMSFSGAFFGALKKGVRMLAFLILPAVAWEKRGTMAAYKKGLGVATAQKSEFASGFVLTELLGAMVFLPPAILFFLSDKLEVTFPDGVWFLTIIYIGFAWSFSMLLEQLFTAELYLWHLLWERDCDRARESGDPAPSLQGVKRPSFIDREPDLSRAMGRV